MENNKTENNKTENNKDELNKEDKCENCKCEQSCEQLRVAVFVDGPNMLRKEFSIDLRDLKERAEKYGRMVIGKVFVNQFAPEKLVEAIINEGFESVMVLGERNDETGDSADVDVSMTVAAMETILANKVDVIGIATRDADFLPVIQKAKEYDHRVVVFGLEPGFSTSLQNAADDLEMM